MFAGSLVPLALLFLSGPGTSFINSMGGEMMISGYLEVFAAILVLVGVFVSQHISVFAPQQLPLS